MFAISRDVRELNIRIMDKDTLSADDFVGEVTYVNRLIYYICANSHSRCGFSIFSRILRIPLGPVFESESVPTTMYNVVKDGTLCGGLNVSLKFNEQVDYNDHVVLIDFS